MKNLTEAGVDDLNKTRNPMIAIPQKIKDIILALNE
jgi:hypothetical protein